MGPLDNAVPVSDTPGFVKLLLYGQPGAGKTTFASDAPNPIWFDFEDSTETLRFTPGKENIPKLNMKGKNQDFLIRAIEALPRSDYETVVLDSISQMQDIHLDDRMERTKGKVAENNPDRFLPLFQDFRISTEAMKYIFRTLQEMSIHVVLIAHDRVFTKTDQKTGTTTVTAIRPDMTPRVNDAVARLINICAYLEKEPSSSFRATASTRKLYLNSTATILAKNRLNIQDTFLTDPSWSDLTKGTLDND